MPQRVDYHEPDVVKAKAAQMKIKVMDKWRTNYDVTTYQCKCACGYQAPVRSHLHEAEDDCMEHRIAENKE